MVEHTTEVEIFTQMSLISLLAVTAIYIVAHTGANRVLPKNASLTDRITFIWMGFSQKCVRPLFVLSSQNIENNNNSGKEYAKADLKWGIADPTVVSLEYLTVLGAGPIAIYILYLLIKNDSTRHYWIVVISTAELYGGWVVIPLWLMWDSYGHIASSLRQVQAISQGKRRA
ncbi:hypothetical protein Clacol_005064 [Clathrus columnatus]|uniref:EXPERA domain-containing protein n=1 Tax=Clathrus columnatus TaxID=1419009 RepID=A0AAV5AEA9_9AGAM|nr:hypothetical protein Clacol_005064 [Clathrus columnatus]